MTAPDTATLQARLEEAAAAALATLQAGQLMGGAAESCTGGLVMAALTAIPGSSSSVERGLVVYANRAKEELLGVPAALLAAHGAVSAQVAEAMVRGLLASTSGLDVGVAVTGIAGPGGGSAEKPVGLVYLGALRRGGAPLVERHVFPGDRQQIRLAAAARALALLADVSDQRHVRG